MEKKILDVHSLQTEVSQGIMRCNNVLASAESSIALMEALKYVIMEDSMGFSFSAEDVAKQGPQHRIPGKALHGGARNESKSRWRG